MFDVRVTWEHFQKAGGNYQNPTQCHRCQKWGHGTKNCRMDAKCMIYGGSSHAKDVCPVKEDTTKFMCSNCGANHKSNFWDSPSSKRDVEARARQMKDNIRYDNGRFRNFPGRVSNNTHFSVNDRLITNHTHQEDDNHAHSQTNFNPSDGSPTLSGMQFTGRPLPGKPFTGKSLPGRTIYRKIISLFLAFFINVVLTVLWYFRSIF